MAKPKGKREFEKSRRKSADNIDGNLKLLAPELFF